MSRRPRPCRRRTVDAEPRQQLRSAGVVIVWVSLSSASEGRCDESFRLFLRDRFCRDSQGAGTGGPIAAPPSFEVIVAYFDTSRAELSSSARRDLDRAATWLATNGYARVLVEGY